MILENQKLVVLAYECRRLLSVNLEQNALSLASWLPLMSQIEELCESEWERRTNFVRVLCAGHFSQDADLGVGNEDLFQHASALCDFLNIGCGIKWWKDYTRTALLTASSMCLGNADQSTSQMVNAALGIAGEVLELVSELSAPLKPSPVVLLKEAGDILWYLALFGNAVDVDASVMENAASPEEKFSSLDLVPPLPRVCFLTETVKKVSFQGHNYRAFLSPIFVCLSDIVRWLGALLEKENLNILDAAKMNLVKLYARYPGGFSVRGSVERLENTSTTAQATEPGSATLSGGAKGRWDDLPALQHPATEPAV